ncbi:hypothetical protein ABZ434_30820 [Streptomyces sp. NPDC005761]
MATFLIQAASAVSSLGGGGAGLDLHDRTPMAGQQQAVTEFTEA